MSSHRRALGLLTKQCRLPYPQRRFFANGSNRYDEIPGDSTRSHARVDDTDRSSEPGVILDDGRNHPEFWRRVRVLQGWDDQIKSVEGGYVGGQIEQQRTERREWGSLVRRCYVADTVRYDLKSEKIKAAQERFETRAARASALPPKKWTIRAGKPKATKIPKHSHKTANDAEEAEHRRRQSDRDRMDIALGKVESPGRSQHRQFEHHALFNQWQKEHLPPRKHSPIPRRSQRALSQVLSNWVDSLAPAFNPQHFRQFIAEASVVGRIANERYERELQQTYPRLGLQYLLLKQCANSGIRMLASIEHIDSLLQNDGFRASPNGIIFESHMQRFVSWLVDYGDSLKDFIPRLGQYCERLSDEEVAIRLQKFNACALKIPYFDLDTYSGTINPVFWPRAQPSGI